MGAAPLSWLAKIGGDTLKTKAKLLSSAINELHDNGLKKGDTVGLDYIKAATADDLKNKVPEAKAVKELNNSLGGFTPIIDSTGKITGYKTMVGADTVFPFSSLNCTITGTLKAWTMWRVNNGSPFKPGHLCNNTVTIVIRDGVVKSITNNSGGGDMSSFPNNTGSVSVAFGVDSIKLD